MMMAMYINHTLTLILLTIWSYLQLGLFDNIHNNKIINEYDKHYSLIKIYY
jgi:hypothetical protein